MRIRITTRRLGLLAGLLFLTLPSVVFGEGQPWCGTAVSGSPQSGTPPAPCGPCGNGSGSPIFVKLGSYFTSVVDLQLPTPGLPIVISRDYLGARVLDSGMGMGWSLSAGVRLFYTHYLLSAPSTYQKRADVTFPDGRQYYFIENADGLTYTTGPGRKDALVKNGDGTWDLTPQRTRSKYHFSVTGALLWMKDDNGNTINVTYDGSGRLQQVADAAGSGRYATVSYGADGRVSVIQDSAGRQVKYYYNASDGTLTSVVDPENRTTSYAYAQGRFSKLLSGVTDNWNRAVTTITYEKYGRVESYTEDGEAYSYAYEYQGAVNRTAKTDSLGNLTVFQFNDLGIIESIFYPKGLNGSPPTKATTYNADGLPTSVLDEVGVVTKYENYNAQGNYTHLYHQTPPETAWDYIYDSTFPEKLSRVNAPADWQSSHYDYYPAGNLFHVYRVRSDGSGEDLLATYEYFANGQLKAQTTPTGGRTDYAYDPQGNLRSVTTPANNDAGTRPVTQYGYDSLGRVTSVTDPLLHTTTYTYDNLGRVKTVTLPKPAPGSPLNFVTTYLYDVVDGAYPGLLFTNVTDPNGKVTKLGHDQYGRLVKSIDAAGNATTYAYGRGQLTSITDANNNVTSYDYDERKRLKTTTFPDGKTETYAYWNDGLLKTKTDRKDQTITYNYDSFKRLTSKTSKQGSITYFYSGQKLTSVLDTSVTPSETHAFGYDTSFRVSSNAQGPRGTLGYTYFADDRIATAAVSGGPTRTNAYYPDGSLNTVAWSPLSGQFKYAYTLSGQYQQLTDPSGQHRDYAYDDQGRLTQLANLYPAAGNLATFGYGYDIDPFTSAATLLGQRTVLTANVPSQGFANALTKYGYDALYQLVRADYPAKAPFGSESVFWAYDAIGNRLTTTSNGTQQVYGYFKNGANPLNGQRLQTDGVNTYAYDFNGSTTSRSGAPGSFTFGYDVENRQISISGAATATYTYDYQGRRTSKTTGGVTTSYLYDGVNLVRESAASTTDYLFGSGIDEPLALNRATGPSYLAIDGLGSDVLEADPAGVVSHGTVFDAWGVTRSETGTRFSAFGYTSREVETAGLWFYRARYYDPSIGRFTQEDPVFSSQWRQLYAYVDNNPLSGLDPFGLATVHTWTSAPLFNHRCDGNDPIAFWDEAPQGTRPGTKAFDDWEDEFRSKCKGYAPKLDRHWDKHPILRPKGAGFNARTYAVGPYNAGNQGGNGAPEMFMLCCIQCENKPAPFTPW